MKVTEPISIGTNNEGKKIFIKRPCKKFADIAAYQEAFAAEATQGMGWAHPNLLNYISLQKDEQGWYITFEYTPAVPLNRALLDGVLQINTVTEFKQIMNQLMDAVAYLHSRNICHLDLCPGNILLLKGRMMCFWQIQPIYTYHILLLFLSLKKNMQHRNSLKKTPFLHSRVIFIRLARSWSTFTVTPI